MADLTPATAHLALYQHLARACVCVCPIQVIKHMDWCASHGCIRMLRLCCAHVQVQNQPRQPIKGACVLHWRSVLRGGHHRNQKQSHGHCGEAGTAAGHP